MLKKINRSLISRVSRAVRILRRHWINLTNVGVRLEPGVEVFGNVRICVTDGGYLHIKSNTSISSGTNITVQYGRVDIGNNVFIGIGVVIVAKESIKIGDDTLIAEYVVIRDQDHSYINSPIKNAGFNTGAISIGRDVWVGCKATILRSVSIGEHSVIAAHSLVNSDVPSSVVVAGTPARIVKEIE